MILFQNIPVKQYQLYDDTILELGYPPISVLKEILSGKKSPLHLSEHYSVAGVRTQLEYSYSLSLNDINAVYHDAASLVRKKHFLYYFGGVVMSDYSGCIQREISSCYRILANKKIESVTAEKVIISSNVLCHCQQGLPQVRAGSVLQHLSDYSKSVVRDERRIMQLGFARITSETFAARQTDDAGDLIFIIKLDFGRSLLLIPLKQDDVNGLLAFRHR